MSVDKAEIIATYGKDEKDTGSTEVQIALLSSRIAQLTEHLKVNKKDFSTRRSLLKMAGKRRRLLRYLQRKAKNRYEELLKSLKIRGV